ncbi:MAG: aldehyde dehydrogenase family protein, partial [Bacteroidia bacterium]|nr:aldehyde dehydrogenase family protein [Bacteroidia bacterium]
MASAAPQTPYRAQLEAALARLGLTSPAPAYSTGLHWAETAYGTPHTVHSPTDGQPIATAQFADTAGFEAVVHQADAAARQWRDWPAPRRGEVVRQIGEQLRTHKADLATLVSYEMGKIYQEGLGEVQEMIDICDFAAGLSRQLYGLTFPSERPHHRLQERWHPLGVVGVISAFNFPVAVWSWNAMVGAVCGNATLWKPSEKTPLCAVAVQHLLRPVLEANGVPEGTFSFINGGREVGQALAADRRVALVSATGSTRMGLAVGETVARRMGRSLLELGGNNAVIVTANARLELALPAIVFGAVGTTGQRCTSTRRVIAHASVYEALKAKLVQAYGQLAPRIGHPLDGQTLIGPLIDGAAIEMMERRLEQIQTEGGTVLIPGGRHTVAGCEGGHYVRPVLVEAPATLPSIQHETFAPILYLLRYTTFDEALALHNGVPQGLSSSIFTDNVQ